MLTSSAEIAEFVEKKQTEFVGIRFCDVPGIQQHFAIPAATFADDTLENGLMSDGSFIRGPTVIHESNMRLVPDIPSAFLDPFRAVMALVVNFSIVDPSTDEPSSHDPRQVAAKTEAYLYSTGIANTCFIDAGAEFCLFSGICYQVSPNPTFFSIDSPEAYWNTDTKEEDGNLGYKVPVKEDYFPVSSQGQYCGVHDKMIRKLAAVGLDTERAHHEVGSGGRQKINYRFAPPQKTADDVMKFKYVIKNTTLKLGYSATFMSKSFFSDNDSKMHTHLSLWKNGEPLFHDGHDCGSLLDLARWFIRGLLERASILLAFTNPSVNSFRRLAPGSEAPINLVYSARNRSVCVHTPVTGTSPKTKQVEYRVLDPSVNPHLSSAAYLMAGTDGIKRRTEPAASIDKDLYELPSVEYLDIAKLPSSLEAAPEALREDHEFLIEGDVSIQDPIDMQLDYKETREVTPMRVYPHSLEYQMYYDL